MSTRLFVRHGQAPSIRPPRRDPFNPWAFLVLMGAIVGGAGWLVGLVTW